MTIIALLLFVGYLAVGFGLRTWLQVRRTGDTGFRGISGRPGTPEWWAGVLFVGALAVGLLGPIAGLLGLEPVEVLVVPGVQVAGLALAGIGMVGTLLTQMEMGTNWRIGVEETERTELVTSGAFALVRNPIFTALAFAGIGLALMVPNAVALAGVALLLVALQLQVRVVEEPYLIRTHGETYTAYAARTGRFLPGTGRLDTVAAAETVT